MDTLNPFIIWLFVINNAFWMLLLYVLVPKKDIEIHIFEKKGAPPTIFKVPPSPQIPVEDLMKKKNEPLEVSVTNPDLQDLTEGIDLSAVAESMGYKKS